MAQLTPTELLASVRPIDERAAGGQYLPLHVRGIHARIQKHRISIAPWGCDKRLSRHSAHRSRLECCSLQYDREAGRRSSAELLPSNAHIDVQWVQLAHRCRR